jgi:carbamoyltransferase
MIHWGINALNHGSSLAIFNNNKLKSWYNCSLDKLDTSVITEALNYGAPDNIFWYERPWVKKARQVYAGQYKTALDMSVLPKRYLDKIRLHYAPVRYAPHHASHAAAGYYTSPFNHCAVVVLDAIGEFECATIWEAKHGEMKKAWSRSYPHSLGLFYSAFTHLVGLTPIKDEYLLQQMAEQGDPKRFRDHVSNYFDSDTLKLNYNFHKGVLNWSNILDKQEQYDIAASVQERFEIEVSKVMKLAVQLTGADCLVYMGGCAMNSRANENVVEPLFKYRWSLPSPGDPSSSVGAVLYHTQQREWDFKWNPIKHIKIKI